MNNNLIKLGILTSTLLQASPGYAEVSCIYCNCSDEVYAVSELDICVQECHVTTGCFTGICDLIEIPGRLPHTDLGETAWVNPKDGSKYSEYMIQKDSFPDLKCYGVIKSLDKSYNCIASTTGDLYWVWDEVDIYYGNNDGIVTVEDFDLYYFYGGYTVSDNCEQVAGKHKIALWGKINNKGEIEPTHAASQSTLPNLPGSDWWETKEGDFKTIIHKLNDISGTRYGEVIKCYERQL